MLRRTAEDLAVAMGYLLPCAEADVAASFSFRAHSSQQTSTVLPAMVTLIGSPSSVQSHAAHVFSITIFSFNTRDPGKSSRP